MSNDPKTLFRSALLTSALLPVALVFGGCGDDGSSSGPGTSEGTSEGESTNGESSDASAGSSSGSAQTTGASGTAGGSETGTTGEPGTSSSGQTTDPSTTSDDTTTTSTTDDPTTGDPTTTGGDFEPVRFIAMGDGGEGNDGQYQVANTLEMLCPEIGCDFVIYLGDNFYDEGVDAVDDTQFITKFEEPYADLSMPFYISLGNHDYGLIANNWGKADYQIDYSDFSEKWTLPSVWYDFERENTHFFALDTSRIFWGYQWDEQLEWLQQGTANSDATWKFAFGHHPYISNGQHGNAGNYEGLGFPIPIISGEDVKDFMDEGICGDVDVYFCGHDHNRQWLEPVCGTEFIVSGTAAKNTDLEYHDDQPTFFDDDTKNGFLWVEVMGDTLTGRFYDEDGNMEYERILTK